MLVMLDISGIVHAASDNPQTMQGLDMINKQYIVCHTYKMNQDVHGTYKRA